jgi:ABC-type sulfate/molybdate transport systems ATPase subunit
MAELTDTILLDVQAVQKHLDSIQLQSISFQLAAGSKLAIIGESGSGKSSLLKIIGGLTAADGGQVLFQGKRVKGPEEVLLPGHPGIAYLSQHFELRNNYRMEELLEYGNKLNPAMMQDLIELCQIGHLLKRKNDTLSGGERQRIALAKLLLTKPSLLLLDEPFSNLDMQHRKAIRNIVNGISHQLQITCIMVSHDPLDVLPWADTVMVLEAGKLIQSGSPQHVYQYPLNAYAAGLLGEYITLSDAIRSLFQLDAQLQFIRPEQVQITKNGIHAMVLEAQYCGGFTAYTLDTVAGQMLMHSTDHGFEKGSSLNICIQAI